MAKLQRKPFSAAWIFGCLLVLSIIHSPGLAQPGGRLGQSVKKENEVADPAESRFPGGASLKTDPELQRLVVRSEQFVKEQRFDLACVLWQKVLDEAGDNLMTRDGRVYISVRNDVERTLAKLPKLGLMTYRISADGEAQAVLSRGEQDEEKALGEVVRRYFISSLGDDAAYKLGCYALDRHDFVSAARLFEKVLTQYPDPSIPRAELLIRYALAAARLGDRKTAETSLAEIQKGAGPKPVSEVLTYVSRETQQSSIIQEFIETEINWKMSLGNSQRTGRMPVLPTSTTAKTLSELWVQEFPLSINTATPQNPNGMVFMGGLGGRIVSSSGGKKQIAAAPTREQIVSQWRQSGWMPTSQLLFDQGRVFYKTCDGLESFDQKAPHALKSRALWKNDYEIDSLSWTTMMYGMNYGMAMNQNDGRPKAPLDVLLFGDRVHASMSISEGLVYSIEGKQSTSNTPAVPMQGQRFQWGSAPRRSRRNWLSCYEVKSGKLRWHRPAGENEKDGAASPDIGFLSSPVPFADTLLVPVTEGGTIWLYALSRDDGRNLWKSYLCDEPIGSCSAWSPAAVAIDGSDAYVLAGTGVVFAVDAASGSIHWAARYQRDSKLKNRGNTNQFGIPNMPQEFNGWSEDTLVVKGRSLVCMPSDSDKLITLDRRTGEILWDSPRTSSLTGTATSYCVGVTDRGLIVAGKDIVRRYDIQSGKLIWDRTLEGSFGRGAVTADSVYVPVKDSILVLDAATGNEKHQVGVKLTTNDPVGNLYIDGEKIWIASPGRLITLTNYEARLAALEKLIADGDHEAQLNRMRLYAKSDLLREAVDDLLAVYRKLQKSGGDTNAQQTLLDAMSELRLAHLHPQFALEVLEKVYVGAKTEITPQHLARRRDMLSASLGALKSAKGVKPVDAILPIVPILDQDYLMATASVSLAEGTTPADKDLLLGVLSGKDVSGKIVVQSALAKHAPAELREKINDLLQTNDDRLKITTARTLLNLGERPALLEFVKLLDAEDPRIRLRAYQSLRSVTGQTLAFNPYDQTANRRTMADGWKTWVTANIAEAKLKLPLPETDLPLGRILIASRGQLAELDEARNERWTKQVNNAFVCQGLPNGNRLYAIYGNAAGQSMVVEVSEEGEEVWKSAALPSGPFGMQRLANGNTVVSCTDTNQVLELSPLGETVWQMQVDGRPMGIQRLENGHTLICLSQGQKVIEVDADKKIVWETRNVNGPSSVQRLPNGNTLITEMYTSRVVEFDPSGKREVWKKDGVNNPRDARRLPNGNTLIAENQSVQEVDPQGKVVWRRNANNPTSISLY